MALNHETAGSCGMEVGYFLMTYSHVWTCRHTVSITRDCSLNAVVELWAAFLPSSSNKYVLQNSHRFHLYSGRNLGPCGRRWWPSLSSTLKNLTHPSERYDLHGPSRTGVLGNLLLQGNGTELTCLRMQNKFLFLVAETNKTPVNVSFALFFF